MSSSEEALEVFSTGPVEQLKHLTSYVNGADGTGGDICTAGSSSSQRRSQRESWQTRNIEFKRFVPQGVGWGGGG